MAKKFQSWWGGRYFSEVSEGAPADAYMEAWCSVERLQSNGGVDIVSASSDVGGDPVV